MTDKTTDTLGMAGRDSLERLAPNNSENLSLVKSYLSASMEAVKSLHDGGGSGMEVAECRSLVMDRLIMSLYELAGREYCLKYPKVDQKCTLVAIGGYGRGELSPASDIDIMFLYPWKVGPYIETVIERILYILWDTGLDIGYSARNVDDCVKVAGDDLVAKTSLIDSRYICGDEALYSDYRKVLVEQIFAKNINSFIEDKVDEGNERRKKYGGSVYLLEPDIKEGDGGLRDLQTALWAAKVRFKAKDFKELNLSGVISDKEYREICRVHDFMSRVRNDLHFLLNRKSDQLTFELQEKIAGNMGYKDEGELLAVEKLMKDYYLVANSIKELSELIVDRSLNWGKRKSALGVITRRELSDGFRLFKGEITISDKDLFIKRPSLIMKLFELSQLHGVPIHSFARECLRESLDLIDGDFRASSEVNESFMNILKGEWDVDETLKIMHKTEVLNRFIPEFGKIQCQVQHDLYHIYTVDIHSLFAVEELKRVAEGECSEKYPLKTTLMQESERPEVLYMAVLFHDIGKGKGGKHEEVGAQIARGLCERIGFSAKDVGDIEFLILKHLRLSHTAQRRDLHDPKLILDFAKEMGTLERLKMLYLLTYADIKAIGPDVWNEWKSALFLELYNKTAEVFEKGTFEIEDTKEKVAGIYREVEKLVDEDFPSAEINSFLDSMPGRYLLSTTPKRIVDHMKVASRYKEPLYIDVTHNEKRKYTRLIITTLDTPGLFYRICGVLAANSINILGAQIYSRSGGEVLDVFHVKSGTGEIVADRHKWEKIENDLLDIIQGVRRVEDFFKEDKSSILDGRYTPGIKTRVVINNEISDANTVVEVYAQDRIGLLYTISSTLFNMGIYIDVAKISTMGEQVTDVFYIKDIFGQKIYYEEKLKEIKIKLTEAVERWLCS